MKRLILFVLSLCFLILPSIGQDIIVTVDGNEIQSKIDEISTETIKYKEFDFQEGPLRNIKISEVFMVIYENGKREIFSLNGEIETEKEGTKNEPSNSDYKGTYFMLGIGIGNSYGFPGAILEYRHGIGLYQGIGFHAGAGDGPEFPVLVSVGAKYYPHKWLYVNAQFGIFGERDFYQSHDGTYCGPVLYMVRRF